jgi:hypothetical protein
MTEHYDYSHDISDDDWPGSHMLPRPRTITPPHPGQHLSPHTQRMIDAESGERLDAELAKGLTAAADSTRHLSVRREHVDRSHQSVRPMLEHIFGLNLPGRGRA